MNFDLNEEQQLLAETVRRFFARDYAFDARRRILALPQGWSETLWNSLAELGLLGLPVPTEHGGYGGGALDMMTVMEAIGEALVLEPYLATVGLGAQFVARTGSEEQKKRWLPAVAEGRLKLAFAQTETDARYDLARVSARARKEGDGYVYVIDGEKRVVLHAPCADKIVVSARTSGSAGDRTGISLFMVEAASPGVAMARYRTLDAMPAADVTFRDVRVPIDALLGHEGEGLEAIEEVVDFATALVCAEAVGAMRSANDATLEYLKTRRQFGMPIGAFQALQHRMVDMTISLEQARSMACLACSAVDAGIDARSRGRTVSAAKIRIAEACRHVSQESVQLHGGMGMTDELKVSHTFRRLTMLAQQFGDADHHLARFAALA